jgi:hypothetical protein
MAKAPQAAQTGQVVPFSPSINPLAAAVWPDSGDAADLLGIVQDQAETIAEQAILLARYQQVLNTAQVVTAPANVATGTGTATGTALALTGVTGTIVNGASVNGLGVPAGTIILGQQSGTTGGAGTYTTSQATTAAAAPLAFTPPSSAAVATGTGTATGTALAVTNVGGSIAIGSTVSGPNVPAATTIVNQMSGTPGGAGTYTTSVATTATAAALAFTPVATEPASPWPVPRDAPTLMLVLQNQTALIRTQAASIQHYQDVLNSSQTPMA